ncbi:pentatricopeptide repeat-containing protein At2g34400-like [Elaeis guineensis]|uniref:Pentatricopeptide repeat-containing protein At2g33680-like n=1 Tax=Elaeis guineensis var. tenera TaxID=51953 RepID=A0A8N4IG77_ELAGV|nr:pentatricopeptide repeat-containing protein At2g33680-like [Elaeis guineensis]
MFSKCAVVANVYFLFGNTLLLEISSHGNEMIQGYNLNGYGLVALQLFHSVVELGIEADEFTYVNVLDPCQGIQDQKSGEQIHDQVIKNQDSGVGVLGAFISRQGFHNEALSLLNSSRETGEKPDEFSLGSAMNACTNVALIDQSKCIHSHVIDTGYEKHFSVASAVKDGSANGGESSSSKQAFDSVSRDDDASSL